MISLGDSFGSYKVVRKLGQGGMGEVWLLESASGKQVAAKFLDPESAGDHEARRRFLREAQLAIDVKHPNLVETYDVGEDPDTGLCYILMEYVSGGSLADYLKEQGALSIEDAVAVVEAMAGVLELGRQKGIVHRDIKPANIMFSAGGTPKLADLGIARGGSAGTETTTVTQTGMMIGTPAYMAPEQMLDSHNVDTRADIYSLGVVFFEMLTGERPNKDDTVVQLMAKAVKGEPLPDVRTLRPEVSASLAQLLAMMVAPDKEGRISTPGQITNALAVIERGGKFVSRAELERKQREAQREALLRKQAQKRKLLVAGVAAVFVGLVAAVVLLAMKKSPTQQRIAVAPMESVSPRQSAVVVTNVVTKVVESPLTEVVKPAPKVTAPVTKVTADDDVRKAGRHPKSDGKIYSARVGEYTWSYYLEGDEAVISRVPRNDEKTGGAAICPLPSGRIVVPATLDGHKVAAIGNQAFADCAELTEVVVPEGVRELRGYGTFGGCQSLNSVQLPRSLETIVGWYVFVDCNQLQELDLRQCRKVSGLSIRKRNLRIRCDSDNPWLSIDGNGAIYNRDRTVLMRWPHENAQLNLPESVRAIAEGACSDCRFQTLRLPEGIVEIGTSSFRSCHRLKEVSLPKSVRKLGYSVFGVCGSLRRVVVEGDAPTCDDADDEWKSAFGKTSDDLVVYVKRGSNGWLADDGEGLPELWPENQAVKRKIRYLDERSADKQEVAARPTKVFDIGIGVRAPAVEYKASFITPVQVKRMLDKDGWSAMRKATETMFKGWRVCSKQQSKFPKYLRKNNTGESALGYLAEYKGAKDVLRTYGDGDVLERPSSVPIRPGQHLRFRACSENGVTIMAEVNGAKTFCDGHALNGTDWEEFDIDLSKLAGKKVMLILNVAGRSGGQPTIQWQGIEVKRENSVHLSGA